MMLVQVHEYMQYTDCAFTLALTGSIYSLCCLLRQSLYKETVHIRHKRHFRPFHLPGPEHIGYFI